MSTPRRFDERWRLSRAGIVNVWHYLDNEFDLSGGRMILRGTNGSGKSRALEMLLPFLLDADRRRMDATGAARVSLDELMRTGAREQANRTGYLWLELTRPQEYLTVGALVRHSQSANSTKVWYFTTPLRVGPELRLLSDSREPCSRDALIERIGADRVTDSPVAHRDRVRAEVFGLDGDAGRDRYLGLLQLLHTLRAPDVGNRIDEGRLPQILLDSLPPLGEQALSRAGDQLDGLTETRAALQRLEQSANHVGKFLGVYRRYARGVLRAAAGEALDAAGSVDASRREAEERAREFAELQHEHGTLRAREKDLGDEVAELDNALHAIQSREIFKTADDLVQRDRTVAALADAVDQALAGAERERSSHARDVQDADRALAEVRQAVDDCARNLARTREALGDAGLPARGLPDAVRVIDAAGAAETALIRTGRNDPPRSVHRPVPAAAELVPADLEAARHIAVAAGATASDRLALAERRLAEARRLAKQSEQVARADAEAERQDAAAAAERDLAQRRADERDALAVGLAHGWRTWTAGANTTELLGPVDWSGYAAVRPLLIDEGALTGDLDSAPAEHDTALAELDATAENAARPARSDIAAEQARLGLADAAAAEAARTLRAERADLAAAHDPLPPDAPWLGSDRAGEPLWRCVDFADGVPGAARAGLEGALLAAGLLTAVVSADGSVRAADGEILLRAGAARPARPLSGVLRPDPAAALPAPTISAVLDSVGADDAQASTGVFVDGSWRNGPLHGRHVVDRARYIGAAARAAHRAERIAAIDEQLAALAREADERATRRAELASLGARIDVLVRSAPSSRELFSARRLAVDAAARAEASAAVAVREAERARQLRADWTTGLDSHRAACAHHGLPVEGDALQASVDASRRARERSERLGESLAAAARHTERHAERLRRVADAIVRRTAAEDEAERHWHQWHAAASELAAQHDALDLSIEQATRELERTRTEREKSERKRRAAADAVAELGLRVGGAEHDSTAAAELVRTRIAALVTCAQRFTYRLAQPGLLTAATDEPLSGSSIPSSADEVAAAARGALGSVPEPRQPASLTTVLNAFREFDREVSGQLDVRHARRRRGPPRRGRRSGRRPHTGRRRSRPRGTGRAGPHGAQRSRAGGVHALRPGRDRRGTAAAGQPGRPADRGDERQPARHPDEQRHRRPARLGAARGTRGAAPRSRAGRHLRRRAVRGAERRAHRVAPAPRGDQLRRRSRAAATPPTWRSPSTTARGTRCE